MTNFNRTAARGLMTLVMLAGITQAPGLDAQAEQRRQVFEKRGEIRDWRPRSWKSAYQKRTQHYTVRTNASMEVAVYIGELMEMTSARYREIFGGRFAKLPNLLVNAYATRDEYEEIARGVGFPPGQTGGFYHRGGSGEIHLFYEMIGQTHPSLVLFHEGTHQFVHQVVDYKIPFELKSGIPPELHILPSTPIWLNEGLATYMETAFYDGRSLQVGRLNLGRLGHLQRMLHSKTNPPVREVVERRYGQPFGVEHYAMAWGLVFSLQHNRDQKRRADNRRRFVQYVQLCQKGFFANPAAGFRQEFIQDGTRLAEDFAVKWNVRVGERSREEFERVFVGSRSTIEDWEGQWAADILALDPRKPYGGTGGEEENQNLRVGR